ncbi:MltG/YceG/YrrL family protein [Anaeromicropila herbilytica]|uniref:Uncharacterized protein n=1 Tax=Anaeromicropila herbilytica TaxID=2785025 RepID=A0A7R7ENE2_9FIRM|nr:hypothetical protein [Anaeromicropila herbilytica]BCN31712.1 hypothetical protein bsdtb5_30070 [Anaeromicropila herbilytica]
MTAQRSKANSFMKFMSFILQLSLNLVFYVVVILLIMMLTTKAYNFSYQVFGNVVVDSKPGHEAQIKVNKGESTLDLAKVLESNRLIADKYSFFVKAKLTEQAILPGKYILNSSMTYSEILDVITKVASNKDKVSKE